MGLDFKRGADLFLGTEEELARALGVDSGTLSRHRRDPARAPSALIASLGRVLQERGRAMVRVGEMLEEEAEEPGGNGNGRGGP